MLQLSKEGARLLDADAVMHAQFPRAEAEERFVLPSFWKSIADLGIVADDGATIWFGPHPDRLAAVKRYLASALAAQGPQAVQGQRQKARLEIWGGLGLMPMGIAACVL